MNEASAQITPEKLSSMIASFLTEMRKGTSVVPVVVTPETNLLDDVGLDSLEITELIYRLEDAAGAKLDLDRLELRHFRRVRDFAEFIDESKR